MKSILLMILFFVGVAVAAPIEVDERVEYATSLNSMASTVMSWYGSLIIANKPIPFVATEQHWDAYRTHYPENISQIHITSTDLTRVESSDQYQFNVISRINYKDMDGEHSQLNSETFIFKVPLLTKSTIESVSRDKVEQTELTHTPEFNRSYYKSREFAYAWLAYLDGVDEMKQVINGGEWLNKAHYSMKIGSKEIEGTVVSTLAKRQKYLAKGGHLLRSLEVKKRENKPNVFMLDLILEWKGINQAGKPVLAKIHQEIEYQLDENNRWDVMSIKEEHLLPDIAPWVGLLC